jgi:protein TonB
MSGERRPSFWRRWPDGLRWTACFVLVLGAHATAAAALIGHWRAEDELVASGPVILIDLAPVAAAPVAPPSEVAPGPQQTQSPPEPQPEPKPEKTERPDEPTVTGDVKPTPEQPVEKTEPPPMPLPPLPQTHTVLQDVVMPPPRPTEKIKERKRRQRLADLTSEPTRTERKAVHAMAPAPGAAAHNPNAVPHWKTALVARLERYKRYPAEAQARGEQGVAQLAFSVDRSGGVHHARILRSSGSSLLDRATLALVARAQPLPPPPPEVRGAQIAIVVPIRYNMR